MIEKQLPQPRPGGQEPSRSKDLFDMLERIWQEPTPLAGFTGAAALNPAVDVSQTDEEILVKAELPGLEAKDVDVSLTGDLLTITGEKKQEREEKEENFTRTERSYGAFSRAIPLPAQVVSDQAAATFENGVLRIRLPKAQKGPPKQAKRIEIA